MKILYEFSFSFGFVSLVLFWVNPAFSGSYIIQRIVKKDWIQKRKKVFSIEKLWFTKTKTYLLCLLSTTYFQYCDAIHRHYLIGLKYEINLIESSCLEILFCYLNISRQEIARKLLQKENHQKNSDYLITNSVLNSKDNSSIYK